MSFLKEVLRGIAIGVANIIPGVSGGTMMVSMGIYGDVIRGGNGNAKTFLEERKVFASLCDWHADWNRRTVICNRIFLFGISI